MALLHTAFLTLHVVASTMWVGGVFMAAFIDWPTVKENVRDGKFPFRFIVGHGRRIFFWVYSAIVAQIVSGVALTYIIDISPGNDVSFIVIKSVALSIMAGFTLYGTLVTWPKLQVAVDREAFRIYQVYIYRAYVIFGCGLVSIILGLRI